ncbi:MAG TPA: hypothetical protein DEB47_07165 [Citreicella sp.]|jgi:transcriptional regulator with XRE-family HTH domain|nr:hypothetical protein [Citreicella sp.]
MVLDNWLVARARPSAYYPRMAGISFRDRVLEAMRERGMNKAELSRLSGVPYHTIDKFLKRDSASTSANNAVAISRALGIKVDGQREYEELQQMFYRLSEAEREFVLASVRGLLAKDRE